MDGNGGCCIARWADEVYAAAGYDPTQMDKIMLKFRPIAPKPVSGSGAVVATSDSSNGSPRGSPHAKVAGRGRRKTVNNNNKRSSCNNGKKRKSSSPDQTVDTGPHDADHHDGYYDDRRRGGCGGGGVTLLPLFPEAPDLSPDNYRMCHGYV